MSWNSGGIRLGQVASQSLNYSTSMAGEVFRFVFLGVKIFLLSAGILKCLPSPPLQCTVSSGFIRFVGDGWTLRIPSSVSFFL